MHIGGYVLILLGATLIAAMVVDIVWTAIAVGSGSGPITRTIGRSVWTAARRFGGGRFPDLGGTLVVGCTLLPWIALLWAGLFLFPIRKRL